jgi:hypothetical protein
MKPNSNSIDKSDVEQVLKQNNNIEKLEITHLDGTKHSYDVKDLNRIKWPVRKARFKLSQGIWHVVDGERVRQSHVKIRKMR